MTLPSGLIAPDLPAGPDEPQRRRRLGDLAWALPAGFLLLVLPPWIRMADHSGRILGLPVLGVYLFLIWFLAILGTARLARRLLAAEPLEPPSAETSGPSPAEPEPPPS